MKNLMLILLMLKPLLAFAQNPEFILTKEGFINKDNSSRHVVHNIDNTTKEVLYGRVLKYITTKYKSAKDVVSKVDNEVITINGAERGLVPCKTLKYDLSYTFSIEFKDNKIKIDAPVFECEAFSYGKPYRLTMSGSNGGFGSEVTVGLFKKDGRPGQEKTIQFLEIFFNIINLEIFVAAATDSSKDDW